MPAIQSGKILVSGANGFVAVWVVKAYLDAGFSVRGTVRSEKSIAHLQKVFKNYGDKFEIVIVPDITVVCCSLLLPKLQSNFVIAGWRI
jgi:nucleoside-diphosphate-sugar epimerase